MEKKRQTVYTLHSSYKDGESESLGVFDSQRAMVAALGRIVFNDHAGLRDAPPDKIAEKVALAVFDFASICDLDSDAEECRDGDTVYGCSEDEVQTLGEDGHA